jgi:hypothetical protein
MKNAARFLRLTDGFTVWSNAMKSKQQTNRREKSSQPEVIGRCKSFAAENPINPGLKM